MGIPDVFYWEYRARKFFINQGAYITFCYFPQGRLLWQSTDDQIVQTIRLEARELPFRLYPEHICTLSSIQDRLEVRGTREDAEDFYKGYM